METSKTLAVGCGAGFSGDRIDAAKPVVRTLVARGGPAALIFENLAERTLAFSNSPNGPIRAWATSRCCWTNCGPSWPTAWRTASPSSATSAPPIRKARPRRSTGWQRSWDWPRRAWRW